MLRMNQIDQIKDLQRQGIGSQEIASKLSLDRKTVAKYMGVDNFAELVAPSVEKPTKLDEFKETINSWLEEDRRMRFKQRHTAKRVHERLKEEYGSTYSCSYPLVQRYMKNRKSARGGEKGYMELVWAFGEAQADFGEADIICNGQFTTIKFLTLSFPASNGAYVQAFGGETAECVAQGLKDIFHRIGGVPSRIVFDNATGVGRRVGEKITFSELFLRFKCHYGFSVSFCNPYSGNEKGNVENKVGYIRRNFFVPMPEVSNLLDWNQVLLSQSEVDFERPHYKQGKLIAELFARDKKALSPLPEKPFNVERHERVHTDGYGKFCLEGKHWYATSPDLANTTMVVGIGAHGITIYDQTGAIQSVHRRVYGSERSDSSNYQTSLNALIRRPGAWKNSNIRTLMDESSRVCLDGVSKDERMRMLTILESNTEALGIEVALSSLSHAIQRGTTDDYSLKALAYRAVYEEMGIGKVIGPDLAAYDVELMGKIEAEV